MFESMNSTTIDVALTERRSDDGDSNAEKRCAEPAIECSRTHVATVHPVDTVDGSGHIVAVHVDAIG
jgi:hypothetical protein